MFWLWHATARAFDNSAPLLPPFTGLVWSGRFVNWVYFRSDFKSPATFSFIPSGCTKCRHSIFVVTGWLVTGTRLAAPAGGREMLRLQAYQDLPLASMVRGWCAWLNVLDIKFLRQRTQILLFRAENEDERSPGTEATALWHNVSFAQYNLGSDGRGGGGLIQLVCWTIFKTDLTRENIIN